MAGYADTLAAWITGAGQLDESTIAGALARRIRTHLGLLVSAASELDVNDQGVGIRASAPAGNLTAAIVDAMARVTGGTTSGNDGSGGAALRLRIEAQLAELADRYVVEN